MRITKFREGAQISRRLVWISFSLCLQPLTQRTRLLRQASPEQALTRWGRFFDLTVTASSRFPSTIPGGQVVDMAGTVRAWSFWSPADLATSCFVDFLGFTGWVQHVVQLRDRGWSHLSSDVGTNRWTD